MTRYIIFATAALLAAGLGACSDDSSSSADAGADTDADTDSDTDTNTDSGTDADTDSDTDSDADTDTEVFWLTPDDIDFQEVDPPLPGECIYYGVWGGTDGLEMISPDGLTTGTRFTANRIWSFGVAHDGVTVAFSSVDPFEEEHWGLTIGDAIQYTWLFAPGEQPAQITAGNINDEGQLFSADDQALYLSRRANFWQEVVDDTLTIGNDPYRILTHDLGSAEETWITPLVESVNDIGPAVLPDGDILFWRQNPDFSQELMRMNGDGSDIASVLDGATGPEVSPDGDLVAYRQTWSTLAIAPADDLLGGATVVDGGDQFFYGISFSPDQTRIAYLLGHAGSSCSDLWVADVDGSDPMMLVDCVENDVFPVGLEWALTE
jgi:hypothetical protein